MTANFTKASLIVPESRIVAGLMLRHVSAEEWKQAIEQDNLLQKKTRNSALTYANLARSRLRTMSPPLWEIVQDGTLREATDAMLAATVKFSPLLGDFLRNVMRDQYRRFATDLEAGVWDHHVDEFERTHPDLPRFTDNTRSKLRQNAMRILHEAGFLHDTQNLRLRSHQIEPRVRRYLEDHQELYVLECLLICP